ncbi:MAG: hypothetical protein Kow0042_05330 [Calditrichia bacterium]
MGDDISAAGKNAGIILSAPFRFDRKKWLLTFSAVGISALVYTMDEPIRRHTEENRERNWDGVMDWARIYGGGHTWRIVATGSYFGGLFLRQSKIRLMGQMLFESELITIFLVSSLKKILGRSRPYENQGAFRYRFLHDLEGSALPSGHAATAFCLSTVLAKTIGKPEVSIALYGMAAMTAASRIYHDAHWTSDVILGSFIGFAVGNAAVNLHQSERIQIHSRGKTVGIRLLL